MAEGSKKRRSPSRSAVDKKIRPASADTFVSSQRSSNDRHLSRAKSDFRGHLNHYFPHTTTSGISLPTSDDYTFRIQVISTTTDVNTDLFKKAVPGLVKICFPQNILEEIGIDIVTQHMHSEGASERNITQMKDIFRSEMIHRVIWMLADYLDTPLKIEASVKAVIAASAGLHGDKIGEDVLGDIIKSLKMLKEQMDHRLSPQIDLSTKEFEPPQKSKKKLKLPFEECLKQKTDLSTEAHDYLDDLASIRRPEDILGQHTRKGKEGKISTLWRWDVKDDVSPATVKANFNRASELFAYHALPVVKRQLGPQAKRKELRQEIQSILTGMSNREFEKWIDSYGKLKQGDITMLQKNTLISALADRRAFSSVPDPGTMETKVISTGNLTTGSDTQRNKL
ncbi:hypothetical protein N0V94_008845 [Neodidymelliopsis sp. IMI 364377]|nr:hypothetical protein N0V94_008845 [Neodidymelliopsis sp. IMI 364377]